MNEDYMIEEEETIDVNDYIAEIRNKIEEIENLLDCIEKETN